MVIPIASISIGLYVLSSLFFFTNLPNLLWIFGFTGTTIIGIALLVYGLSSILRILINKDN